MFAAELLLHYKLFKPRADIADLGLAAVSALADEFNASLISTGSRFATFAREPCAFVLSEGGKVRYSARVRAGENPTGPEEAAPEDWFEDWQREGDFYEDARHLRQLDQTLTLLWFNEGDLPPPPSERKRYEEDSFGLRELDGVLPWPGRSERRP